MTGTPVDRSSRAHVGVVPADERLHLRAFGNLLRAERLAAGLSVPALARRCGCSASLVEKLERGERRPRARTVRVFAGGLDPDDREPLAARLRDAAGASLVADTARSERAWTRRTNRAALCGDRPLPSEIARSIALHSAAAAARVQALAIVNAPGALYNADALDRAIRLMDQAWAAEDEAGLPVAVHIGRRVFRYGFCEELA